MIERHGGGQPGFSGAPNVSIGLRELLDEAPDVIFCCDAKGRFVWLNAAVETITGVKASDLLGRSFTKLVPDPHRSHLARASMKRLRRRQSNVHTDVTKVVTQDQRELWMAVRSKVSMRPDGDLVFIGVARPMDEAELAALAANGQGAAAGALGVARHARHESTTRRANLGIVSGPTAVDPEHTAFSGPYGSGTPAPAAAEPLAIERTELRGPSAAERSPAPPAAAGAEQARSFPGDEPASGPRAEPASSPEILAAIQQANAARAEAERRMAELEEQVAAAGQRATRAESERDAVRGEIEGLRGEMTRTTARRDALERDLEEARRRAQDLERARAEARIQPPPPSDGAPAEARRLQAELDEVRQRHAELVSRHAETEHRLEEAQRALDEARAQAQLKGDFLATISHEIRTPMNSVMGMTHLLLESELDNDQRSLVEIIRNSSQALLSLINDTLDFSKLEAGRLDLEALDFDLRVTVDEVGALLAPMANARGLKFDCRVNHEVPSRLKGDPGRLRQVLYNLGSNAIKFTDRGGVTVQVERLREDDARVDLKFMVHDTGAGVSRDPLARLFQDHSQADSAAARQLGGAGVGLAISRQLVNLMGGDVGVENRPDEGCTFWFRVALEKQSTSAYSGAPPNVQLRGMRVLVVDPARSMRQSVMEMLTVWGCSADDAETAEEALQKLRAAASLEAPYRVALIDMNVADMDGERLGGAIRAEETLEKTLTILMTSIGRKGDAQRAQTMGFSAYLLKPVEWSELYEALIEVVHVRETSAAGAAQPLVTRHSLAEARRGRMRILLVEDNAVNQLVANWALQRLGYTIEVANSATEALNKSEAQHYDLILMDIQMSDMDGYKATSALRARERGGARTPIIAMTGNSEPAELERCQAAGMDDYIAKPIDIGQLCNLVEHWTRRDPGSASVERASRGKDDHITFKAPELERKLEEMARGRSSAGSGAERSAREARDAASAPVSPALDDVDEAAAPIDSARLEESSMGIVALRDTLLTTFLAEVPPRLERLAEAIDARDPRRVEFEAHGLKAMCATVGAIACGRVFTAIERLASEERLADVAALLPRARAEVERTEAYVARLERILNRAA